jgi:hypothetical protein
LAFDSSNAVLSHYPIFDEFAELAAKVQRSTGLMCCVGCDGWFEDGKLNPSSAHPEAAPVCDRCLELEGLRRSAQLAIGELVGGTASEEKAIEELQSALAAKGWRAISRLPTP